MGKFTHTNGIQLHYLEYAGNGPTVVFLHGLSANAYSFAGLAKAGFPYRLLSIDLRGRGLSDKPDSGYSLADHAADVLGLLDNLGLDEVVLGGHSYGGLLTLYMAAHFPERFTQCIVIDSGLMPDNVLDLIKPSLDRLGQTLPSWETFRQTIQAAPYWQGYWDADVEAYYRADVEELADGRIQPRSRPNNIAEAAQKGLDVDWPQLLNQVKQPVLILHALGAYGPLGAPPIIPLDKAQETAALLPNHTYHLIPGNHMTMLFGDNAPLMVAAIKDFID